MWQLVEQSAWAGAAAVGFAVLFNVPPRALLPCGLSGAAGFAVRATVTTAAGVSLELASLVAAIAVSLLSLMWGKRLAAPALIFVIPGVIPLVPGALAFRTMKDLLLLVTSQQEDVHLLFSVVTHGFRTVLTTAALACGVAVPSLFLRRKRPMT